MSETGSEKISWTQDMVADFRLTFKLTGAKSDRAETLRTLREPITGVSGCAGGDVVVSKSLSAICK